MALRTGLSVGLPCPLARASPALTANAEVEIHQRRVHSCDACFSRASKRQARYHEEEHEDGRRNGEVMIRATPTFRKPQRAPSAHFIAMRMRGSNADSSGRFLLERTPEVTASEPSSRNGRQENWKPRAAAPFPRHLEVHELIASGRQAAIAILTTNKARAGQTPRPPISLTWACGIVPGA
jgi:hypothetical protein